MNDFGSRFNPFTGNAPRAPKGRLRRLMPSFYEQRIGIMQAHFRGTFVHSHKGHKKRQHPMRKLYDLEKTKRLYNQALVAEREAPGLFHRQ